MLGFLANTNTTIMNNIVYAMSVVGGYDRIAHEMAVFVLILGYLVQMMNAMRQIPENCPVNLVDRVLLKLHSNITRISTGIEEIMYSFKPKLVKNGGRREIRRGCNPQRERLLKTSMLALLTPTLVMTRTFIFPASLNNSPTSVQIDAESILVSVNNQEPRCISRNRGEFVGHLEDKR